MFFFFVFFRIGVVFFFFFSSRRRHTRCSRDWSSDVCSSDLFARLGAFALLWRWTGWHYRFAWLMCSYVVMLCCFVALLLTANLAVLVCAQLAFGLAVGLIYYSSLFYSMDVGAESQGEHGGYHETVIGAGLFA